ncbi:MAG: GAF domain-containing protein [Thermoplasmata archaeon]|nr:GAF domain-containing protein [Thermoplasmata archaeon]
MLFMNMNYGEKPFNLLLKEIKKIVEKNGGREEKLKEICHLLKKSIPYYNWVGFYIVEGQELILGPFEGEPTEHVRISFGEGICGQAAERMDTFIVQDVSKEENYLSCSPEVKSEIVVPIFKDGKIVAELDIDSHYKALFTREDKEFLEEACSIISEIF